MASNLYFSAFNIQATIGIFFRFSTIIYANSMRNVATKKTNYCC